MIPEGGLLTGVAVPRTAAGALPELAKMAHFQLFVPPVTSVICAEVMTPLHGATNGR
jgi:hypothetical protein